MLKIDNKKLYAAMAAHGLTGAALSQRAGVSRTVVTKILKGGHTCRADVIGKICSALNIELKELIE